MAEYALTHIERYLITRKKAELDAPLFLSTQGFRLTRTALWKSLAVKQRRIELATGVHIFRHTFLSSVDQLGGAAIARDLAGHSSITITDTYLHTSPEERKEAVKRTAFADLLQ